MTNVDSPSSGLAVNRGRSVAYLDSEALALGVWLEVVLDAPVISRATANTVGILAAWLFVEHNLGVAFSRRS